MSKKKMLQHRKYIDKVISDAYEVHPIAIYGFLESKGCAIELCEEAQDHISFSQLDFTSKLRELLYQEKVLDALFALSDASSRIQSRASDLAYLIEEHL